MRSGIVCAMLGLRVGRSRRRWTSPKVMCAAQPFCVNGANVLRARRAAAPDQRRGIFDGEMRDVDAARVHPPRAAAGAVEDDRVAGDDGTVAAAGLDRGDEATIERADGQADFLTRHVQRRDAARRALDRHEFRLVLFPFARIVRRNGDHRTGAAPRRLPKRQPARTQPLERRVSWPLDPQPTRQIVRHRRFDRRQPLRPSASFACSAPEPAAPGRSAPRPTVCSSSAVPSGAHAIATMDSLRDCRARSRQTSGHSRSTAETNRAKRGDCAGSTVGTILVSLSP